MTWGMSMEKTLAVKLVGIGLLAALLMLALNRVGGLVQERQARRDAVIQDIARSSGGEQQLAGPILIVPYEKTIREWRENDRGERHLEERTAAGQLTFLPENLQLEGPVRTERRARGIYEARIYHANLRIRAQFAVPARAGVPESDFAAYRFGPAFIALGVTDIRGIGSPLRATLDGAPLDVLPGTGTVRLAAGLHTGAASTSEAWARDGVADLQLVLELPLQGSGGLYIVPAGRQTQIDLSSNWPDPSFAGDFLPVQRTVDSKGFTARWATSFFSTNLQEVLSRCGEEASCPEFTNHALGVSFLDPVDQYLKTDRAIKYALLFISLTYAGFFLFDVLKKLPVHAIQYGLVGAALALFYLLLLSLAEHVGFDLAYLLSSLACVGLIAFYVSNVLHSVARGIGFGFALAVLYGCLFGLLAADDYALLMGSLLLFALLTAVMVITRNVNWSQAVTGRMSI